MIRTSIVSESKKKKHTTKYYIYCEQIAPSLTSLLLLLLLCTNERKKMSFIRCSKLNVLRLMSSVFFVFIIFLLGRERCVGFSVFHACKICIKIRVDEQNEAFQESNLTTSFIFVPFRFNFILWRFSF